MKYWTPDELAAAIKMSKSWIYSNWKSIGLEKSNHSQSLRFSSESVKRAFSELID